MKKNFKRTRNLIINTYTLDKNRHWVLILLSMGGIEEGGSEEGGSEDGGSEEGGSEEGGSEEGGSEEGGTFDEGTTSGSDDIPGDPDYEGDDWGNYNGYGSPDNPIQLDTVVITPANKNDANAWGSLGRALLGIIEVVGGVAATPETGGLGVYLIIDGFGRTGANLVNFINAIKGNHVPALPTNFGGLIGYGFSGQQGAYWGAITNDVITALVDGGLYPDAEAALDAIAESNFLGAVKFGSASVSDADTIRDWFISWQQNH